jgi:hypothetical protein
MLRTERDGLDDLAHRDSPLEGNLLFERWILLFPFRDILAVFEWGKFDAVVLGIAFIPTFFLAQDSN